jgi:hypothetical protein
MKIAQQVEPPSCLRLPLFMVGQDSHGNWVVQDQSRIRGGLFVDRAEALRFVRAENGNRTPPVVMVAGAFELDMARTPSVASDPQSNVYKQRERQAA